MSKSIHMGAAIVAASFLSALLSLASSASATEWYVDNSLASSGTHNGASWATAWLSPADVVGVAAGDTVYLSGGPAGSSQTYSAISSPGFPDSWIPQGGSSGKPVTYQVGQDAAHDGTVIFDGANTQSYWLAYANYNTDPYSNSSDYVTLSGQVAGDATGQHMIIQNYTSNDAVQGDYSTELTLEFIQFAGEGLRALNAASFTLAHCDVHQQANGDHALTVGSSSVSIHDNTLEVSTSGGDGDDGIQGPAGGAVYNNTISSYFIDNYTAGQHEDGLQTQGASDLLIYNNVFENMGNSCIFLDPTTSTTFSNITIFNNVCFNSSDLIDSGTDYSRGLDIVPFASGITFSNITVVNNLIANENAGGSFYDDGSANNQQNTGWTNCVFSNNILYNAGGETLAPEITSADDVTVNDSTTNPGWVSWVALTSATTGFDYDFHLTSGATSLIGQGENLTSLCATTPALCTDKDGNARPAAGAWDLGPYVYCTGNGCILGSTTGTNSTAGSTSSSTTSGVSNSSTGGGTTGQGTIGGTTSTGATGSSSSGSGGTCETSSATWQSTAIVSQSGTFTATFQATPALASVDAVTGLASGVATAYSSLAVSIRFNAGGTIDALSGASYLTSMIGYTAGTSYAFRVVVDVPDHTYDVYVTPAGMTEQTLGTGYAFRTQQNTLASLDHWAINADVGSHQVCNFAIAAGSSAATTGGTASSVAAASTGAATTGTSSSGTSSGATSSTGTSSSGATTSSSTSAGASGASGTTSAGGGSSGGTTTGTGSTGSVGCATGGSSWSLVPLLLVPLGLRRRRRSLAARA